MKNYVSSTIENTIKDNALIKRGDHVILGLSGGPDSMCLFSVLMELESKMGFTMEVVHVNHKFRPGAAEEDQKYVEEFCDSKGVTCTSFVYDCQAMAEELDTSLENAGRIARYRAFDKVASCHGGNVRIAVAQNMDDQCETMLFRLMRGTGPDGLAAIQYVRKSDMGFDIIRPLLEVDRKSIEEYCEEHELNPRRDHTNQDNAYTRNRIRNKLIPYIEENFNPSFKESLVRLSRSLSDDKDYFRKQVQKTMDEVSGEGCIILHKYAALDRSIRHRVLMAYFDAHGLREDVSQVHIDAVDALALNGTTSKMIELPGEYVAKIIYGRLVIVRKGEDVCEPRNSRKVSAVFSKKALIEAFGTCDYEVRTRRPGDYIYLSSGRKKIKDLFIDMKIPKEDRANIQLVAIGSEVIWIPGIRYSSRYRGGAEPDCIKVDIFVNL